jgi:hypothetical protein
MMLEQIELDFTQPPPQADFSPQPAAQDAPGRAAGTFSVGQHVFLRGARFGLPGTVLRLERGRAVIYWRDLNHISRHKPCTLMLAESETEAER